MSKKIIISLSLKSDAVNVHVARDGSPGSAAQRGDEIHRARGRTYGKPHATIAEGLVKENQ
ncbi:hypothetical protein N7497_006081 [Penicillium chrysogenum]|jgi:hypothetical protein|nr:hypothetical protein N7497_006081 [Penicillium chrysogenum]